MNVLANRAWRSLSGVPLDGDNIVRYIFFDEAGISNRAEEPFVVVAGVIIDADKQLHAIERHLERLVERHLQPRHHEGFVFHATELFNGSYKSDATFKRLKSNEHGPQEYPLERRLLIADDLALIPRKFGLPLAFGVVERANWPRSFVPPDNFSAQDRMVGEHVTAFLTSALRADHWIEKQHHQ